MDAGLGLVLQAREDVEVDLEEALSVLRANGVGEEEPQQVAFVVGEASEGPEMREGRHDERRRGRARARGGRDK